MIFLKTILFLQILSAEPLKISFQVNQADPSLKKFFSKGDSSMLCWPSALAHRMYYLKYYQSADYPNLKLDISPLANVEKFKDSCKTSQNGGTSQKHKLPCIEKAFQEAGYKVKTYSIGEDSQTDRRAVEIKDLTSAFEKNQNVILHIAWFRLDKKTSQWTERGSHSINAYAGEVDPKTKILKLTVVDPGVDYLKYHPDQMYDEVMVHQKDPQLGSMAQLEIVSGRFHSEKRKALVKNIYVFGKN